MWHFGHNAVTARPHGWVQPVALYFLVYCDWFRVYNLSPVCFCRLPVAIRVSCERENRRQLLSTQTDWRVLRPWLFIFFPSNYYRWEERTCSFPVTWLISGPNKHILVSNSIYTIKARVCLYMSKSRLCMKVIIPETALPHLQVVLPRKNLSYAAPLCCGLSRKAINYARQTRSWEKWARRRPHSCQIREASSWWSTRTTLS